MTNENDTRTPEEIERDIERERAGLTNTIEDLQDKFSVETMARQFTDQFREHGDEIGRSVSQAVKSNPIALALTGVGLAWLMMGERAAPRDRYDRRDYRVREYDYDDERDYDSASRTSYPTGTTSSFDKLGADSSMPVRNAPESYYSASTRATMSVPSWARSDDDDDTPGLGEKASDAASDAADSARKAGQSVADSARDAGATIAGKAKGAANAMSNAGKSASESAQDLAMTAQERAEKLRKRLAEGTEELSEEARNRVIAARERAMEARKAAASYARSGTDRVEDLYEEQPLIAGAIALAVGAALGAALPRTQMEDERFGAQSDQLMDEAERIFNEEKQKVASVAKAATNEAREIANEAKANADEAAPADSAAEAIVQKAKESGQRVMDAAKSEADKQNLGDVKKS